MIEPKENERPHRRLLTRAPVESHAVRPESRQISGRWGSLHPLRPCEQVEDLYALSHTPASGPELWEYLPYGPFADLNEMRSWMDDCAASSDPLFYAIADETGRLSGMASYLRIDPKNGSIEMGHIWLSPAIQKSRSGTEALYLMMRHAFDDLGYRRLEWKCNAMNEASRRAARRFGFRYEGTFYRNMIVKGLNRDTAWYAILLDDWPAIREAFETWLSPENFDDAGRQKQRLSELVREGISGTF
ncbi:MAG: GNAT family protein [Kiloniellales bacterium]|nr:GNAT family protein [Kiloniellales bacterium]